MNTHTHTHMHSPLLRYLDETKLNVVRIAMGEGNERKQKTLLYETKSVLYNSSLQCHFALLCECANVYFQRMHIFFVLLLLPLYHTLD